MAVMTTTLTLGTSSALVAHAPHINQLKSSGDEWCRLWMIYNKYILNISRPEGLIVSRTGGGYDTNYDFMPSPFKRHFRCSKMVVLSF